MHESLKRPLFRKKAMEVYQAKQGGKVPGYVYGALIQGVRAAGPFIARQFARPTVQKGLLGIDPTPQKKYVGWMAKKWIEGGKKEIDAQQLEDYIPTYDKLVSTNKIDERDINKFKSIKDLADKIEVIQSTGEDISTSSLEKDADVVLDNEDLLIMSPHTHEASRKLGLSAFAHRKCKGGKDSAWCTTYKSPDHFNDYYYSNKVTFYYTKVLSEDIMEQLQVAFPRRYQALVVMAFAIIPKGNGIVVDAYDGKDKRITKKDIEKIVEIVNKYKNV